MCHVHANTGNEVWAAIERRGSVGTSAAPQTQRKSSLFEDTWTKMLIIVRPTTVPG